MSDDTLTIDPPSEVNSGFRRAAVTPADDEGTDGHSSGFVLQQQGADKARQQREDGRDAATGFKKASSGLGGDAGFRLSGSDSNGNGFTAGPADSGGISGGKWSAFNPNWYKSDQHAHHYARQLNRRLDGIIKRALKNNWTVIGLEMGIAGRVEGNPVLVRALNRRIEELAMGGDKVKPYIEMMGFRPEAVKGQLQNMKAYSGHIDDVMEALKPAAPPPGTPAAAPGTPAPP